MQVSNQMRKVDKVDKYRETVLDPFNDVEMFPLCVKTCLPDPLLENDRRGQVLFFCKAYLYDAMQCNVWASLKKLTLKDVLLYCIALH